MIAFFVISQPHVELTDETLTSWTCTPAASAKARWISTRTPSGWSSTWILMIDPLSLWRSWILALSASMPLSPRTWRALSTVNSSAGTSQATPPSKSMPSTRPWATNDTMVMTTSNSDSAYHRRRLPQKSIAV